MWIAILSIVGVLLLISILIYNSLIAKKNAVDNAFASIDAYLKKRFDLLPNLVSTVQTFMAHEKSLLTEVTKLRTEASKPNLTQEEKVELNNQFSRTLGAVNLAVENYPDIKSNTNFLQLQAAINDIEEQLSAARRAFNAATTDYNNAIQMFPSSIFAGMLGMTAKPLFAAEEFERKNIDVKKLFNS